MIGFTGTGGAGKSSVVDELVRRFHREFPERRIGLLLIDPTRRPRNSARQHGLKCVVHKAGSALKAAVC